MPEGPEIQRACDKVARVLKGEELLEVRIPWSDLTSYQSEWEGCTVKDVRARGKALLTYFDNGDILYSHNQLYGRWLTRKSGKEPDSNRSLRVALVTPKGGAFLYSATDLEVLAENELRTHSYIGSLGPDILDSELTEEDLAERLMSKSFRNRQLASLYLDQKFLAGPGNYLRSEILFCSGVHPRQKPSSLSEKRVLGLAHQTLLLAQRAYKKKGHCVDPELSERLKESGERNRSRRYYVFGREGKSCRICEDGVVEKVKISSRSVFYCPVCQGHSST